MSEQNLPVVGGEYVYKGQNVKVIDVKKRGRGWQVRYAAWSDRGAEIATARLRDWLKGVE